ncbi:hypothetical protein DFJ74DRAFT_681260 [Hyaloraphidium curvatum]|nr:hypothetical protein DFJ74DRAFT_681260 [Hyaloraphidium curvatum]
MGVLDIAISFLEATNLPFRSDTPLTDAQRTALANNLSYIAIMFPGPNLANPGAALRDLLVKEQAIEPGQVLDAQTVWEVYKPAAIMCIIWIVLALITVVVGIVFCAKIHPALVKRYVEKPLNFSRPFSAKRHLLPSFILLCTVAFVIWSSICFMDGAVKFSESMKTANTAVDDLFTLSGLKVIGILPFGNYVFSDLNSTIHQAFDLAMSRIPLQEALVAIEPAVQQAGQNMADARDKLQAVRERIGILNATSGPKAVAKRALSSAADAVGSRVRDAINIELRNPLAVPAQGEALATDDSDPATEAGKLETFVDKVEKILDETEEALLGYNGTAFAQKLRGGAAAAARYVLGILSPPARAIIQKIETIWNEDIAPMLNFLSNVDQQWQALISLLRKVDSVNLAFASLMLIASVVAMIVVFVGIYLRNPRLVGHCLLASFTIGVIGFIFAVLFIAVAIAIASTCQAVGANKLEPLLPTLNQLLGINITNVDVNAIFAARLQCAAGQSAVEVIYELLAQLQLPFVQKEGWQKAAAAVRELSELLNGEKNDEINAAIDAGVDKAVDFVNDGMDKVQAKLREAVTELLDLIRQVLAPLQNLGNRPLFGAVFGRMRSDVAALASSVAEDQVLPGTPDAVQAAILRVERAAEDLVLQINAMDAGPAADMSAANSAVASASTAARDALETLQLALDNLANSVERVMNTTRAFLTTKSVEVASTVKNATRNVAGKIDDLFDELLSCQSIAEDTYILQHAVCIGVARATDELWFGYLLVAFCWSAGTVLLFFAAKKVWDTDPAWRWAGRKLPIEDDSVAAKYAAADKIMEPEMGEATDTKPALKGDLEKGLAYQDQSPPVTEAKMKAEVKEDLKPEVKEDLEGADTQSEGTKAEV